MRHVARQGLNASTFALAVGFVLVGVAAAQAGGTSGSGLVIGEVARCVNGAEQPAPQVNVGVEGGDASLVKTDPGGQFFLALPPGQYTVIATASDGTATRPYVPVEAGQSLDIGILDIGGGVAGCGPASDMTAPILPTFTPTAQATALPATPTLAPTLRPAVAATSTPMPATDETTEPMSGG
jgi:hypothetical protein